MPRRRPIEERFWEKVQKSDGCWIWTAAKNQQGYGSIGDGDGRVIPAHRLSYLLHFGEFDRELNVLHKCDNPSCVRPDHLFLGTQRDNTLDALAKGRALPPIVKRGEAHYKSAVTDEQALEIRLLFKRGTTQSDLAARYGMSCSGLGAILDGRSRKHVGGPLKSKGRQKDQPRRRGEMHPCAKLNESLVMEIRSRHAAGELAIDLAREYGVWTTSIWNVVKLKTWRHIT